MANQEHLNILWQGVEVWNQWRKDHPDIQPDLEGVDLCRFTLCNVQLARAKLRQAELPEADFTGATLTDADLWSADLSKANLSRADCGRAGLVGANLERANLTQANFFSANLSNANLSYANFSEANLTGATLSEAKLMDTNLTATYMQWTVFGNVDLRQAKGLDTVHHPGPSHIGIDTIYRSQGRITEIFLREAGVPESFINVMHALLNAPFEYHRCFISYAKADQAFAVQLYVDLQNKGVRCWFAPEDLPWGAKIRPSLDEAVYSLDKLLLVISKHSLASQWVEQEVETALARERQEQQIILLPIRLDDEVMKIERGWPALVRNTRNIGDFTRWHHVGAYQRAFNRLVRDLKAQSSKSE